MIYIGEIESRMKDLQIDSSFQYSIKDFISTYYNKFIGYNKNNDTDKLIIHFNGNNLNDLVCIHLSNSRDKAVKVRVYRDKVLYQTHIFEDFTELVRVCHSVIWWNFNQLFTD